MQQHQEQQQEIKAKREAEMNQRKLYWPRGKVLGGSSSLNAMVYIRGHAKDFDRWDAEGATGWNYEGVLPYFKRSETYSKGGDFYRFLVPALP